MNARICLDAKKLTKEKSRLYKNRLTFIEFGYSEKAKAWLYVVFEQIPMKGYYSNLKIFAAKRRIQ